MIYLKGILKEGERIMNRLRDLFFYSITRINYVIFIFAILISIGFFGWFSLIGLSISGVIFFFFRKKILSWLEWTYIKIIHKKKAIVLLAIIFQLVVLISAKLLIRRDAAVVFTGAFHYISESSIAEYLTRNPNNLSLFLYERLFFNIFGANGLWIMMFLNMIYINTSACISYHFTKKYFNQEVANLCFLFYMVLIMFSPLFLTMYTDVLSLPLLSIQVGLALSLLKVDNFYEVIRKMSFLGIITGIAYFFRPTSLILIIAFMICLFFHKRFKKMFLSILVFILSFGVIFSGGNFIKKNQTEVQLVEGEGLAKTALVFVDLGLTFTGTDQEDMKDGLLQYIDESEHDNYNNGMFATENVIKDIKRRIANYNIFTFSAHILVKLGATVMDGSLGWTYFEDLQKEKTPYISPLYDKIKDNKFLTIVRHTVITKDTPNYQIIFTIEQLTWLVLLCGLVLSIKKTDKKVIEINFLHLTIFGGLLFLMIFEGGKTRYLIQFLPQIILLASLGWHSKSIGIK